MSKAQEIVEKHFAESGRVKNLVKEKCLESILEAAKLISNCFQNGGKLLLCGNGGSAADCQHVAAEFVSRLTKEFERPALPAIALTTDSSFITAYANDIRFDGIFARQVEALGKSGDVLLGISTSGNSANVINALELAKRIGMRSIGLCGEKGKLKDLCDVCVSVPSNNTQFIQEAHLSIEHVICDLVERHLYNRF